jgi:hypothetical protein
LAKLLALCLLVTACDALLGPHHFTFATADGQLCDGGSECVSGFCSVDGVCCAEACSGPCQSCKGGASCAPVPAGTTGACPENEVCNAEGLCYCSNLYFLGPPTQHAYKTGSQPQSVAAADLNGDGNPDLAVANSYDAVSVLLNQGDGTFAPQVMYTSGLGPRWVAAGDLNGDGTPDLAVADQFAQSVSVLLNQGHGTFAPQVTYDAGQSPSSVLVADLNGDGKPDLAVANNGDNTVSALLNACGP